MSFNPANVIAKKRDGQALCRDEIAEFVSGFTGGSIPDYQMSALGMAIYLHERGGDGGAHRTDVGVGRSVAVAQRCPLRRQTFDRWCRR